MALPAAMVSTLLEDEEIKSGIRSGVKKGASTASVVLKVSGIAIGVTILVIVGKKLYNKIKENSTANKALESQTEGLQKDKRTKNENWFTLRVSELRNALSLDKAAYSDTTRSYNKKTILSILESCGNSHDWLYLVDKFGTQSGKGWFSDDTVPRSLIQWLGYDDEGDIKDYNDVLRKKQVPENGMIVKLQ